MIKNTKYTMIVLMMSLAIAPFAHAGKKSKKEQNNMDPKMLEMMKLTQPSEGHQYLESLAGTFETTTQYWMGPDSKPETNKGRSENEMILGGRFLRQKFVGNQKANQPQYEGFGLMGYDNIRKEYTSVWVDNMSTGTMEGRATFDASTKTFSETGTFSCPMTGEKNRWFASKTTLKGKDSYTLEMFAKDPKTGKEYKMMEISYQRAN